MTENLHVAKNSQNWIPFPYHKIRCDIAFERRGCWPESVMHRLTYKYGRRFGLAKRCIALSHYCENGLFAALTHWSFCLVQDIEGNMRLTMIA